MSSWWVDEHRRTVLVVVPSVETGMWLMDAVPLLAADQRIATSFTVPPTESGPSATEYLAARGLPTVPWRRAVGSAFDLVLAADSRGLTQLSGKKLMLPFGADRPEVAPDLLALAHSPALPTDCPTAVVGDLCYDRLMASIPFRAGYRRVFGLSRGQRLVVVTSTVDGLLDRLLSVLPPERYRVAALLPPRVWAHGSWQVRVWLSDYLLAGLLLPQPESWRSTLLAADIVVGDVGMPLRYGAAIGLPVLATPSAEDRPGADEATELVRQQAIRLNGEQPLPAQIEAAIRADRAWQDGLVDLVTARSGRAGDLLRAAMYELLGLPESTRPGPYFPVSAPRFIYSENVFPHAG